MNKCNYKHGEGHGTKLYRVWDSMKQRCINPKHKAFKYYGGKGIIVCTEWLEYTFFRDWALNNGYKENMFIDRIDNNVGYEPNNCRWVTVKESNRNQVRTKISMSKATDIRKLHKEFNNSARDLSLKYNVTVSTIYKIIQNRTWIEEV